MLKVTCSDGIDLKFLDDENIVYTIEEGTLTIKNDKTKETLLRMEEGKWSNVVAVPGEVTITT